MATKMKGLLKGLRYISQIFDEDEKEPEMQIGYPTDVKHVAHIGWEGPSVSSPSWMTEFKGPQEPSSEPLNTTAEAQLDSITKSKEEKKKSSRHHQSVSSASPLNSLTRRSRRNRSYDSPTKDSSGSTSRHSRRNQNSGFGQVPALQDQPASPKNSRRRRSKGSSGGGSMRGSRSKGQNSVMDADSGSGSRHRLKNSVFEVVEEEK